MKLNGKEYGLFWSVGAKCIWERWVVKNQDAPISEGYVMKALAMIDGYNMAHKTNAKITKEEIFNLPSREFAALIAAVDAQEKADTEVTVEVEDEKPKKEKSAGAR